MILLIDNYDSFSYNLYQLIGGINPDIKVIRNDEFTCEEIEKMNPSHLIISPGPGRPLDAGICEEVIQFFKGKIPIFGVCLGHQAICEVFGSEITYADQLMHGKVSKIKVNNEAKIFKGIPETIEVGRYHSLAVNNETLSQELLILGEADDGEIMAVKHAEYEIYGVQFHPESILTNAGEQILRNFLGE